MFRFQLELHFFNRLRRIADPQRGNALVAHLQMAILCAGQGCGTWIRRVCPQLWYLDVYGGGHWRLYHYAVGLRKNARERDSGYPSKKERGLERPLSLP